MTVALQLSILNMWAKLKVLLYVVSILKYNKIKSFVSTEYLDEIVTYENRNDERLILCQIVPLSRTDVLGTLYCHPGSHTRRWIRYNVKRINKLILEGLLAI